MGSVPRSRTMESGGDAEDVPIETFVETFAKLSRRGRRLAIQKLVSTLDSDEMDMVIEAIDTKIDDVKPKPEEPKPEVDQDPLQCSCSHCSVLARRSNDQDDECRAEEAGEESVLELPHRGELAEVRWLQESSLLQC